MKMTKAYAKEILDLWKDSSAVYRGAMTLGQLENLLGSAKSADGKPLLTQADVIAITMALKIAGANID